MTDSALVHNVAHEFGGAFIDIVKRLLDKTEIMVRCGEMEHRVAVPESAPQRVNVANVALEVLMSRMILGWAVQVEND